MIHLLPEDVGVDDANVQQAPEDVGVDDANVQRAPEDVFPPSPVSTTHTVV